MQLCAPSTLSFSQSAGAGWQLSKKGRRWKLKIREGEEGAAGVGNRRTCRCCQQASQPTKAPVAMLHCPQYAGAMGSHEPSGVTCQASRGAGGGGRRTRAAPAPRAGQGGWS